MLNLVRPAGAAPKVSALSAASANTMFAFEPRDRAPAANVFPGASRVTLPADGALDIGLEVAGGPGAQIWTHRERSTGCCGYLWGLVGHPTVDRDRLLPWIMQQLAGGNCIALRELSGMFVVLIDDRRHRCVRMVSDVMGLRPWYVGVHRGRLVCGSDVWRIHDAGFNDSAVNLDAIASWVRHGYDNTSGSVLANYSRMGFGVVGTWGDGKYVESSYASYEGAQHQPPIPELLDEIHARVTRSFDSVTRELDRVTVSLSGGYDSRYLAALAAARGMKVEAFCVRDDPSESAAAAMVAQGLDIPLHVIQTDGTMWNLYDQPFHFAPNGLPISKQTSYLAAAQRPGVPCLNGFMGDGIIRGMLDCWEGRPEQDYADQLAPLYQKRQRVSHRDARFDLLDPRFIAHCDDRALAQHRRNLDSWAHTDHRLFGVGAFIKQRLLFDNNFLQHLDIAEGLTPFIQYDSLAYKFRMHFSGYSYQTYAELFRRFYPKIGHIPHNHDLGIKRRKRPQMSGAARRWAGQVLRCLAGSRCLSIVDRRKTMPRLLAAMAGRADMEVVATFLYRLFLLEDRLSRANIPFDWRWI